MLPNQYGATTPTKNPADGTADSQHQVVAGELAGVRLQAREFAVTDHAADEEGEQVDRHRNENGELVEAQRGQDGKSGETEDE